MVSLLRIYADAAGDSHFEDRELRFDEADFVPPAPPVLLTPPFAATGCVIEQVHPGWQGDWHPAPQRVLAVYLSGAGEIDASDGETRALVPGTILLAEDTSGRGHVTRVIGDSTMHVLIVLLEE